MKKISEKSASLVSSLIKDLDITENQAIAFAGNLNFESDGLQANINEVDPKVKGSRGGFGLAQWTGVRRKQFEAFTKKNNLEPGSFEASYSFLINELKNTDGLSKLKFFLGEFKKKGSIEDANDFLINKFFFPAPENRDPRKRLQASHAVKAQFEQDNLNKDSSRIVQEPNVVEEDQVTTIEPEQDESAPVTTEMAEPPIQQEQPMEVDEPQETEQETQPKPIGASQTTESQDLRMQLPTEDQPDLNEPKESGVDGDAVRSGSLLSDEQRQEIKDAQAKLADQYDNLHKEVVGYKDKDAINLGGNSWGGPYSNVGFVGRRPLMNSKTNSTPIGANQKPTIKTQRPVFINGEYLNQFELDNQSQGILPSPTKEREDGFGIFATGLEAIKRYSLAGIAYDNAVHRVENLEGVDPDEVAPDGWKWSDGIEKILATVPEKYWYRFIDAETPGQRAAILNGIRQDQKKDMQYANGSWIGAIGGTLATGISPEIAIPFIAATKAAKLTAGTIEGMKAAFPYVSYSNIGHNAAKQLMVNNANISDAIEETVISTMVDTLFFGLFLKGEKYYHARKQVKLGGEGFVPKFNLDEKGKWKSEDPYGAGELDNSSIETVQHTPTDEEVQPGGTLSSAESQKQGADLFYQSKVSKEGLFQFDLPSRIVSWASPIFRGLDSENPVLNFLTNTTSSHVIKTIGNKEIIPSPINFEQVFNRLKDQTIVDIVKVKDLIIQHNGLSTPSGIKPKLNKVAEIIKNGQTRSHKKASTEIMLSVINDKKHSSPFLSQAATIFKDSNFKVWERYAKNFGFDPNGIEVKTALSYGSVVYDTVFLKGNPTEYQTLHTQTIKNGNKFISGKTSELNIVKSQLDSLVEENESLLLDEDFTDTERKAMALALKSLKAKHLHLRRKIADEIKESVDSQILIDNPSGVTGQQSIEIEKIQQPFNAAKLQHGKAVRKTEKHKVKVKDNVKKRKAIMKKIATAKAKLNTAKNKVKAQERLSKLEEENKKLKSEVEPLKKELEALNKADFEKETKMETEEEKLNELLAGETLDSKLYTTENNPNKDALHLVRKFKNPKNLFKYRDIIEDFDMPRLARSSWESITGNTDGALLDMALKDILGFSATDSLRTRTNMIPHAELIKSGFAVSDVEHIMKLYQNSINRKSAMKEAYGQVEGDGSYGEFIIMSNRWARGQRREIAKIKNKEERTKASSKFEKKFEAQNEDMKSIFDRANGKSNMSAKTQGTVNDLRNLASFTFLASVPLTMITDPIVAMFKAGVWPAISRSIRPFINIMKKDPRHKKFIEHLLVSLEGRSSALANRFNDPSAAGDRATTGILSNALEKFSGATARFSGTNLFNNIQEQIFAGMNEILFMEWLEKFVAGTIKDSELQSLLQYGIDPKKFAKIMIEQKNKHSHVGGTGVENWTHSEAQIQFSDAIRASLRDILLRKDLLSNPLWMDSSVGALVGLFKSFTFSALNRLTIPLMQTPDANKVIGSILSFAIGSLITPLRKLSRGQEAFSDDDSMVFDGIIDGNVLSVFSEVFNITNTLLSGALTNGFVHDKARHQNVMSIAMGPLGSLANFAANFATHAMSGDLNKADVQKIYRFFPLLSMWYFKGFVESGIENSDIPKIRPGIDN